MKKALKRNWNKFAENMTDKYLDIRDKWLGIKYFKRKTSRNLYETADRHGNITSFKQKADAAVDYLEKTQWGNGEAVFVEATEQARTTLQNKKLIFSDKTYLTLMN